jgi:DNA polymerase elongation subunit (family B)
LNDVEETLELSEKLSQASFYMTQMIPQTYERLIRAGQGSKLESLFVREYLRQGHSIPKPEYGKQDDGGYADLINRGVFSNIMYVDVEALYPSIMLNYSIQPESDELKIFQPMLKAIFDLRFDWKNKMRSYERHTPAYTQYDGQQNAAKIVGNSLYGNLSAPYFPFNDYSEGQRVAVTGQKILKEIMKMIQDDGGMVIEVDTDGVMMLPPKHVKVGDKESELAYVASLNERTPKGIVIGLDGVYEKMVSFKTKNYVLREKADSEPKFKGSAIISRGNEPFINKFVKNAFRLMLDEDIEGIREMYLDLRRKLTQKRLGISEFAATNTLKKTLKEYEAGVKINGLRYPQYEIALDLAKRGRPIGPGDRITYYVALPEEKRVWEMAKWDGDYNDDENVNHYLGRLDAAMKKLKPMLKKEDFNLLREVDTGSFSLHIGDIKIPKINVKTGESYESKGTEVNGQCQDAGTGKSRFRWMGCSFHGADDDLARLDRHSLNRLVSGTDLLWREGFLPGDSGEEPERIGSET